MQAEATVDTLAEAIDRGDQDAALVEAARLKIDLLAVQRSLEAYAQRGDTPSEAAGFARVAKRAAELLAKAPIRIDGAAGFLRFLDRFGSKKPR